MRLPPATDVDNLTNLQPLPSQKAFNKPLASNDDLDALVKDLDPKPTVTFDLNNEDKSQEEDDDDVIVEHSHLSQEVLPPDYPFTFLYLSSEESSFEASELDKLTLSDSWSLPEDPRKQGVSPTSLSPPTRFSTAAVERDSNGWLQVNKNLTT